MKQTGTGLILGTMTFGMQVFDREAEDMLDAAFSAGVRELDSAWVYNGGRTEQILGQALRRFERSSYRLDTKVTPHETHELGHDTVVRQLTQSLERLQTEYADVLYLHFPNRATPIEQTLAACAELHDAGKFRTLGLSNFPLELTRQAVELCKAHGWPAPSVYEGVYNALTRTLEPVLPELHALGMRVTAYNPLAGGLLTGKYQNAAEPPQTGRFFAMRGYQDRYWKPSYFAAMEQITAECSACGIAPAEAALRWLLHHSGLDTAAGDAVILGASSAAQLRQNCASAQNGPLPQRIIKAMDSAWQCCRADAPAYCRYIG